MDSSVCEIRSLTIDQTSRLTQVWDREHDDEFSTQSTREIPPSRTCTMSLRVISSGVW